MNSQQLEQPPEKQVVNCVPETDRPGLRTSYSSHLVLLLLILLAGVVVRGIGLNAKSVWYDEAISTASLDLSYSEIILRKADATSVHPPFYFLVLKLWSQLLGDSQFSLRSIALCFGILTILGMYNFVRRLCLFSQIENSTASYVALWTAFLVATSPLQIVTSQQIRGYSLGTCLFAWSSFLLLLGFMSTGRRSLLAWAGWALLSVLFCYTSNIAVLSVAGQSLFICLYVLQLYVNKPGQQEAINETEWNKNRLQNRTQIRYAILSLLALIMFYGLPWGARFLSQASTVQNTQAISRPLTSKQIALEVYRTVCTSWAAPHTKNLLFAWLTTVFVLACLMWAMKRFKWSGIYLGLTGLLPVLLILNFSAFSNRSIMQSRYLTFSQIMWLAAIALVFFHKKDSSLRKDLISSAFIIFAFWSITLNWQVHGTHHKAGMREVVENILENRQPDDIIIARDRFVFFGMKYYLRDHATPKILVDSKDRSLMRAGYELNDDDLILPAELLKTSANKLWMVETSSYQLPQRSEFQIPPSWGLEFSLSYEQDQYWEKEIEVRYYNRTEKLPLLSSDSH